MAVMPESRSERVDLRDPVRAPGADHAHLTRPPRPNSFHGWQAPAKPRHFRADLTRPVVCRRVKSGRPE